MKTLKIPPHIVIDYSKEVIFYISKKSNTEADISGWMKLLNLPAYRGMIINSKCIFNRLKNKKCD